jgi:hypothetical protein
MGMLHWDPIGMPDDHDEYSFLLQAETFASGRFANPQHPMWEHFESFHILLTPTYASKYPPGQAFFLFLGIKFFGHAWYGVLLSCMLMTASIVWMVRGYSGTNWAIIIGVFIIVRFALWNYWSSSYWGGAVAATGGALLFGALPRFDSTKTWRLLMASLCLGFGLTLLSQTRPFEGLLVAILPGLYYLNLLYKRTREKQSRVVFRMIVPALAILVINFSITGYYNYKITGDPLVMPYSLHNQQYSVQSPFLFVDQREEPPTYNHDILERHHNGWELIEINSIKDYLSLKKWHFEKFIRFFYYWPVLVALCLFFIDRKDIEIPFWSFLLFCAHLPFTSWFHPHYFAPVLAVYYLLLVKSVDYLINHRYLLLRRVATIGLVMFLLVTLAGARFFATRHSGYINGSQAYVFQKQHLMDELSQQPGDHVVLVKYSDEHKLHHEWVYNDSNLDNSKILWARYISEEKTSELKSYFKDRKFWFLHPDEFPDRLIAY